MNFDVDQYLLGEESVPVTVRVDSENVLFLKKDSRAVSSSLPSTDLFATPGKHGPSLSGELAKGISLDLPLYLGVSTHTRGLTQIVQLPRHFSSQTIRDLNATKFCLGDTRYKQLNLRRLSPYFFDLAVSFSFLLDDLPDGFDGEGFEEQSEDLQSELAGLMRHLLEAFERRYRTWLVKAYSPVPNEDDLKSAEAQLTNVEAKLFFGAARAVRMLEEWERNRVSEGGHAEVSIEHRRASQLPLGDDTEMEPEEEGEAPQEQAAKLTGRKRRRRKRSHKKDMGRRVGFFDYSEEEANRMQMEMEGGQVQDEDGDAEMHEDAEMPEEAEAQGDATTGEDEGPPRKRRRKNVQEGK